MRSELNSSKWFWGGIGFQFGTGYTVSFFIYQIGTLITTGSLGNGFLPGLIVVAVFAAIVTYLCIKAEQQVKAEQSLKKMGA